MILITSKEIDFTAVTDSVRNHRAGAVNLFLGTVREFTGDTQTQSLEYEAHAAMAQSEMQKLADEAKHRWKLIEISIVHRVGHLGLGDIAVAVAVSAPHRPEAFEGGRWLIDTLKERVPIWKKENYTEGNSEWIHPGVDNEASSATDGNTVA